MLTQPDTSEVLERITDGIIVYDREWRFRYLNATAEKYFDRRREELLGKTFLEAFPGGGRPAVLGPLYEAARTGEPTEYEELGLMGHWLLFRVFPTPEGVTLYFTDVTERKRREQALQASEARHRAIFENSLEAILLTNPNGETLAANPAACRLLGRTEEEIVALGRAGVIDASDGRAARLIEERARSGHARGVLTMIRKDGSRFEAEVSSGLFTVADGSVRTSVSFHDLTPHFEAQRAVEFLSAAGSALLGSLNYEQTIQKLIELAVPFLGDYAGFYVVEGRRIRRAGQGGRPPSGPELRRFQAGAEWRRGTAIERVLVSGQPEFVPTVTDDYLREATVDDTHYAAAKKVNVVSAMILPLIAGGETLGVLALSVSRPRRAYTQRDFDLARGLADRAAMAILSSKLYRQANEARRLRDDSLNAVSHDLRSPLNGVLLAASSLQRKLPQAPEPELIQKLVRRCQRLLDDLLLAAMLESRALPLERRQESIGAVVAEVVALHSPLAESKSITLHAEIEDGLPLAWIDRHRILQVLSNLIANAIKFTPSAGDITVAAKQAGDRIELSVTDTGSGISKEDLPHVFDRFWQSARTKQAGVGLGLAISKGIVEAHGGTIRCESEPGRGSRFSFTVSSPQPRAEPPHVPDAR